LLTRRWISSITGNFARPRVRLVLLTLYYLAIVLMLILLYSTGNFATSSFVYQGF
jgi:hypothetical protein